jgi:hypothetical protein
MTASGILKNFTLGLAHLLWRQNAAIQYNRNIQHKKIIKIREKLMEYS